MELSSSKIKQFIIFQEMEPSGSKIKKFIRFLEMELSCLKFKSFQEGIFQARKIKTNLLRKDIFIYMKKKFLKKFMKKIVKNVFIGKFRNVTFKF